MAKANHHEGTFTCWRLACYNGKGKSVAYNGSGTFIINSTGQPVVSNTVISATVFNAFTADIGTGLTNCITKDGQQTVTANIPWNGNKITNLGNGSAASDAAAYGQLTSALGDLTGFIGALTLSAAGSTGTFGIAAGTASDSTSVLLLSLASAFTKTTSNFVAGTGNGALDTGSIANTTWYHVFIIGAAGVASDILFSLSPTSPTLPAGYTLFRRIGSMLTDGSAHWVAFHQVGNYFRWNTPLSDYSAAPGVTTAITATLTVPTGLVVLPDILFVLNSNGFGVTAGGQRAIITALNDTDVDPASAAFQIWVQPLANYLGSSTNLTTIPTNTSSQLRLRVSGTDATVTVFTMGWTDLRGSQ